ncbi:nucleotide-binding universal stress UspA family protein [Pseudonocardia endophytica]|uniref:Nucleotide-binding universal stress UspA family protein n=2 Tax=Pseudonocardia endophytica TaxID=401976 RepID=A0A4R1HJI2_PSEEN|nr:nucleotide-binding universal stress UspA family protein [Pseudonocardia endophytica]
MLVAYGHGPDGDHVLRVAAGLAARIGATLLVVHVVDIRDEPVDPDAAAFDEDTERAVAGLRTHVDAVLGDLDGPQWTQTVLRGDPVRALSAAAEEHDVAMIVVGSRGGGAGAALSRLLEPSVSQGLIRHQHRPVLVVPS